MHVSIENGNVDHIVVRSCGHILHVPLDLSSMEPLTIILMFLDCQIAVRVGKEIYLNLRMCDYTDFEKNIL